MGGHAADARTTTRANRGLSRCRGPSARTCKEMPGASCELDAELKETGTMIDLTSNADTFNSLFIPLTPRLELAPEGGWLVHRGSHAWLASDRRQALREFKLLERIEPDRLLST